MERGLKMEVARRQEQASKTPDGPAAGVPSQKGVTRMAIQGSLGGGEVPR
jgi:hypothetical protein